MLYVIVCNIDSEVEGLKYGGGAVGLQTVRGYCAVTCVGCFN